MREDLSGIVEVFSPTAESTSSCPGLAWQGGWWFPCYEGTPQAVWHTKLCPSTPFQPRITMTERQTWAEKVTRSEIESQVRNITVSAKVGILHSHPIPPRGPKGRCRCKGVSPGSARQLRSTPTPRQTSPALPQPPAAVAAAVPARQRSSDLISGCRWVTGRKMDRNELCLLKDWHTKRVNKQTKSINQIFVPLLHFSADSRQSSQKLKKKKKLKSAF